MAALADHVWGMKTINPPSQILVHTPHVLALAQLGEQRAWMASRLYQLGAGGAIPFTFAHHPRGRPTPT